MTGEIDLNGSVHAIGGLETKLDGAKKAGVNFLAYRCKVSSKKY